MRKLYCYVDESGRLEQPHFVVSIVMVANVDAARAALVKIEIAANKQRKWAKSRNEILVTFIERLLAASEFSAVLRYAVYNPPGVHRLRLIKAIAAAVKSQPSVDKVSVCIDGLADELYIPLANDLRAEGVPIYSVKGARDESEPLLRAADALAGFARDALLGRSPFDRLFRAAEKSERIRRVP
ncbi:MAG: DUF3800 domain-containing protein [Aggregatilineales bacterium]